MNWYKMSQKNECNGWTAVRMNATVSNKIQNWGKENIPSSSLAHDGRETDTHITVLYGICTKNRDVVKELFKKEKPIKAKLGKVGCFVNNDDFDVIIVKIESKDLEELHKKVKEALNVELTHDDYKPHCTIAYVKKGEARKHSGNSIFAGEEIVFSEVVFKDGVSETETVVSLKG